MEVRLTEIYSDPAEYEVLEKYILVYNIYYVYSFILTFCFKPFLIQVCMY